MSQTNKITVLFLGIFFSLSNAFAQDSIQTISYNKKRERGTNLLVYKLQTGQYDELLNLANKYSKKWNKEAKPSENIFLLLLKAETNFALMKFESANNLATEAENLFLQKKETLTGKEGALSNYYLANYYQNIGNYSSAEKFCKTADSISSTISSEFLKSDIQLLKAKILFHQEFYDEAFDLITKQEAFRLKMLSIPKSKKKASKNSNNILESIKATVVAPSGLTCTIEEDRWFINFKSEKRIRNERYADLKVLKAGIYLKKELTAEAEQEINVDKEWIKKNISQNSISYRNLLAIEAEQARYKNSYEKAANLFHSAYTSFDCKEDEVNKINNLSEAIVSYLKAKDFVQSRNYLRRLQMHAFQYVGKNERFHIAYDYTTSVQEFLEGDLTHASSRLTSFLNNSKGMPQFHYHYIRVKELQSSIARRGNDIKGLNETELELAEIKGTYYGKNTPAYHKALLTIAIEEIHYGSRFNFAADIFKNSYDGFLKQKIKPYSKENSYYLTAYAELYLKLDRFDSAMSKASKVAAINRNVYGENSEEYLLGLANFSEYAILSGKYQLGIDSLKKVIVLSNVKSSDVIMRQKTLLAIARLSKLFGEYEKGKDIAIRASDLSNKDTYKYEQDILVKVETKEQLADVYIQSENYTRARKKLEEALPEIRITLGENSPKLIPFYFCYARLSLTTGNLSQSDLYLNKAKTLTDSIFGSNSITMSEYHFLSGNYYALINDFKRAEDAYKKADNIQSKILGKKHLKRAETILSLAALYTNQDSYKTADIEKIYKEALDITKNAIGSTSPLYAEIQGKYAEFLIKSGSYDAADKLLEEAEKFWTTKLGNENRHTAYINLLRGNIAYAKNKYDDAEKKYAKAKSSYLSIFNDVHPGYIKSIGKLARVYYMKNNSDKALDAMNEIIPKYLEYTRVNFPSLSFRQKSNYWKDLKDEFEFYTFVALQQPSKGTNTKYTGKVYNNILATKALLLSSSIKLLDKIQNSKDTTLISLYNQWVSEKEYMISLLSLSKSELTEQGIDINAIQTNTEHLEKQMSQHSELFNLAEIEKQVTWEDVRSKLGPNEYAVEIVRFRHFKKEFTDSVIYAALIVEKATKENPDLVLMPNGKKMEGRYLNYYRNVSNMNIPDEFSFDIYWQPIKSKIPDLARIYLSCDGVYNQLNLEMMPRKGTEVYVLDENQLVLLTNTKDLMHLEEIAPSKKKAKELAKSKENKKANPDKYVFGGSPKFYTNKSIIKKNIPDLPGAEKEVTELNSLLASADKSSMLLLNGDITEDTLKSLVNPKVLHIATHGFFKEAAVKGVSEDDIATNPLLNSGLMLFGSGDIVDNPDNKYVNQKDGILTAYEAMDLNLDNTDIVILSACETGRGEVQTGEGVYGLQRAFLIAGAKAIVISLFKVNDEVTKKLMFSFYQKWLKTGDKRQAFIDAKKEIKAEYKMPLNWGAFIMIEGHPEKFNNNSN